MPHAEKRDGKLTGFWYGEVDRRHKGGERFRRRFETKAKAEGYEAYVKATGEEPPGLAEGDITGRTFASVAAVQGGLRAQRGLCASGRSWWPQISQRFTPRAVVIAQAGALLRDFESRSGVFSLRLGGGGGPIQSRCELMRADARVTQTCVTDNHRLRRSVGFHCC
jgi:hypothetical protein